MSSFNLRAAFIYICDDSLFRLGESQFRNCVSNSLYLGAVVFVTVFFLQNAHFVDFHSDFVDRVRLAV